MVAAGAFTKTFRFEDINYTVASKEDKEAMFLQYSELLNAFDSGATYKITIIVKKLDKEEFKKSILIALKGDALDKYREEYNRMAINSTKAELQNSEDKLAQLNYALNNSQGAMKKLDFYYDQFRGWAEEFEDADLEQRKMIICQLVREINVSKGYELDIVLDMNYEQFLSA
jgi:hypothetical protein